MKTKIAILGAGASGFGTYSAFKNENEKFDITIFNSPIKNKKNSTIKIKKIINERNIHEYYEGLKKLSNSNSYNKKNNYGSTYSFIGNSFSKIIDSNYQYGLTQFWGGILQTFDHDSISKICSESESLKKAYISISKLIPITKPSENFNNSFLYKLANKPGIEKNNLINILESNFTKSSEWAYGTNSVAMKVDNNTSSECYCLAGCCKTHSIFSTLNYFKNRKNLKIVNKNIKKIDFDKKIIFFENEKKKFDKIFINLGPYNSQKIINQNMGSGSDTIKVKDSHIFMFPIIYLGNLPHEKKYFELTNEIINIKNNFKDFATIQIYPPNKHLIRYMLPKYFFSLGDIFYKFIFNRILFASVISNDENSIIKKFNENSYIESSIDKKNYEETIFNQFNEKLNKKNLFIPIKYFHRPITSAHYSGKDFLKKEIFNIKKNEIFKDIVLNDSTLWDYMPSYSPTLTIMAYANMIAKKNFNNFS